MRAASADQFSLGLAPYRFLRRGLLAPAGLADLEPFLSGGIHVIPVVSFPVGDLLLSFFFGYPVLLLDLSSKLITPASNRVQVIICEFSPLFLHFALELLPVSLNLIPVHFDSPLIFIEQACTRLFFDAQFINDVLNPFHAACNLGRTFNLGLIFYKPAELDFSIPSHHGDVAAIDTRLGK